MNLTELIGKLLGISDAAEVGRIEISLAAPWAHDAPAWLLLGALGLSLLAVWFYRRLQYVRRGFSRLCLTCLRGGCWCLILVILAEPVLTVHMTSRLRPSLWVLFDGTDSMAMADDLPPSERARLAAAVGWSAEGVKATGTADSPARHTRMDYLRAFVERENDNVLKKLERKFRLRFFLLDRADGVRELEPSRSSGGLDLEHLSEQLTTEGQVTALGAGLLDLARRQSGANLAGVVVFSDFNQNAGPSGVEAARRLGVPLHAVGVGPVAAVDLSLDLQCPPTMKKDERFSLGATLRQEGLTGETASVRFTVRKVDAPAGESGTVIAEREVKLAHPVETVEIPYVPAETGRFVFSAEAAPLRDEVVADNNRSEVEVAVHDHFLRLLFVEYEPTWEWRFIKEVFHRDRLVGTKGFRTFLRSADPKVRQSGELFVPTLTPPRSEFFAHDVILLGDMPATALSPRFCQMVEEFVDKLGGGLVVVSGPRFGPGQLASTPLADLLPVKVDPTLRIRDRQPFPLLRTAEASQYDFMQLESGTENEKAWEVLGPLPWYQPVERLHSMAVALAVHPTDKCVDGKTPQPIIAVRNYGRGEVVYLATNEMWRLRRMWGERYYRQFWGQLIHRLASRHALGTQKRFLVRTDRKQYRADQEVLLTVEAYDADFKPLGEDQVPGRKLNGELFVPSGEVPSQQGPRPISVAQLRPGIFEGRFPVYTPGEHRVRIRDPITQQTVDATFQVAALPVERQRATRNAALERALADATGGKSYDLASAAELPERIPLVARTEANVEVIPLWNTWMAFSAVVALMLGEWLFRKWVNLP